LNGRWFEENADNAAWIGTAYLREARYEALGSRTSYKKRGLQEKKRLRNSPPRETTNKKLKQNDAELRAERGDGPSSPDEPTSGGGKDICEAVGLTPRGERSKGRESERAL